MNQIEQAHGLLRLVALQSADQVPAYARECLRLDLAHRLLDVVLADVTCAGVGHFAYGLDPERLRRYHDGHFGRVPARPQRGFGDSRGDRLVAFRYRLT